MFWVNDQHYLAHVIAGKAQLQLGQKEEARTHYKKAIESNSDEQLAWKVLYNVITYIYLHTHIYISLGSS